MAGRTGYAASCVRFAWRSSELQSLLCLRSIAKERRRTLAAIVSILHVS